MRRVHLKGSEVQSSGLVKVNKRKTTLNLEPVNAYRMFMIMPDEHALPFAALSIICLVMRKKNNLEPVNPEP